MEALANPVNKTVKPRPSAGRHRGLEGDEEARLLAASPPALRAVIVIALETAAREGEIAALSWSDIDLERSVARFAQTKIGEPRTIPLSPAAIDTLEGMRAAVAKQSESIFPWKSSGHALSLAFARLCGRLGIVGLHFHDLRHEATSRLFERGLSIEKVVAVTGHGTWAVWRCYTHPRAEDVARELATKR